MSNSQMKLKNTHIFLITFNVSPSNTFANSIGVSYLMDESLDQLLVMNISLLISFIWNQFLQNKNKNRQTIDSSNILNAIQSPMQKCTFPLKMFNKKQIFKSFFIPKS
jgi:hypothetical protein